MEMNKQMISIGYCDLVPKDVFLLVTFLIVWDIVSPDYGRLAQIYPELRLFFYLFLSELIPILE